MVHLENTDMTSDNQLVYQKISQKIRDKGKKQDPIFLAKRIDAIRLGYALKKQMRVSEKLIQNN